MTMEPEKIQTSISREITARDGKLAHAAELKQQAAEEEKAARKIETDPSLKRIVGEQIAFLKARNLPIPDLTGASLEQAEQLLDPVMTAHNQERYANSEQTRAHGKPSIVPSGRYRVRGRALTCMGKTFAAGQEFDASEMSGGVLTLLIDQKKVVRVAESVEPSAAATA